jgi:hypothetical protein
MRLPRLSTLAFVSIVLLGLGAVATFWTFAWWTESSYTVNVSAPGSLKWTMWIPKPERSMSITTTGSLAVIGSIETMHGLLFNLTGTGSGQVQFSASGIAFGSDPLRLVPFRQPVGPGWSVAQWHLLRLAPVVGRNRECDRVEQCPVRRRSSR